MMKKLFLLGMALTESISIYQITQMPVQGHSILWKTAKLPYDFGIPKHENPRPPRLPR